MTELPKLPPLPKPWDARGSSDDPAYTTHQLINYGAACIEAAIKAALAAPIKTSRQDQRWACAAAIRGML